MAKTGLVLEGGGLRGMYSNGILDTFLEEGIEFPYCIGVSAGVCNGVSFISKQPYRSMDINITYINNKDYLSLRNFVKEGSIFGYKMMLDTIPHKLNPFDYETYENSPCVLYACTTNCNTGKPCYFELKNLRQKYDIVRATTSLPFVSTMVDINGEKHLDGGITDSIPIKKAIADGCEKNVIILTRPKEYRKTVSTESKLAKVFYKKYPKLVEALENRHIVYNQTLDYIEKLEQEGKVFVFRPSQNLAVSRTEKDTKKLKAIYELGLEDAKNAMNDFKRWLHSSDC